ncbi:response regulator [candidate division KSB1 bacterium]|nr:response regulator [candidate division KSB1 bacterium]
MSDTKKILIIDDDMDFRETAKIILESENYEVLEAADGESGLDMIKTEKPDFIFLDVMMEEVDTGYKMADKIEQLNLETPVVILSSFADAAKNMFDVSQIPVKEYLQKPIKSDALLAVVHKYL